MSRVYSLFFCLVLVLPAACVGNGNSPTSILPSKARSDDAQKRRDQMVGKWLSESRTAGGDMRLSLAERNENGTYRITFRLYARGQYEESIEVGLWGISGPVYFTIMRGWMNEGKFRRSDASRAYYYDAYKIIKLTATAFEYESLETGNRFGARRVGDDFEFSD